MTYVEIAVSDGPGTLTDHYVRPIEDGKSEIVYVDASNSVQTLTEQEAQAFYTMHGDSWVAV